MKKIVLHGAATDNAGNFCDAGSTLEIGDKVAPGFIDAERARQLVERHGAASVTAEKRIEEATPNFDPAPFTVSSKPAGRYSISGPGLEAPEKVKGKAKMEARVAELRAALPPAATSEADRGDLKPA